MSVSCPVPATRLALGTVQFGLDYGLTSQGAAVPPAEVEAILAAARDGGIGLLDTAGAYGDSEAVLGRLLPAADAFAIVTKIAPLDPGLSASERLGAARDSFARSLCRLGRERVHGLMVHRASDLEGDFGRRLFEAMQSWRDEGRVAKLGVSVYDAGELDRVLERFAVDMVQLPVSVLDQRLVRDGTLQRLTAQGIEVHVRSVFLQGLLLMAPEEVPAHLSPALPVIERFRQRLAAAGATPLQGALAFVRDIAAIRYIVVGVHSAGHLRQCLAAMDGGAIDTTDLAIDDPAIVDPRRWPRLG